MGVRGTHIVVDQPVDRPPSFLVVEGSADLTFTGAAAAGAPAAGADGSRTMVLGTNQMVKGGEAAPATVSSEQAQKIAEQIAPPPAGIQSTSELAHAQEVLPNHPQAQVADAPLPVMDLTVSLTTVPEIHFDPIADQVSPSQSVGVTVVFPKP